MQIPEQTAAKVLAALEQSQRWHNGDKFRESEVEAERSAWEDHHHVLDNALGSLRAALATTKATALVAWQPISTAPTDGTHILVSWPMRQMDGDDAPTGPVTRRDTLVTWMNGGCWIEPDYLGASGAWYGDDDSYAADPDFWMPLPAAPGAASVEAIGEPVALRNSAPKRIHLDIGDQFDLERVLSGGLSWQSLEGVTWSEDNATSHGIPYVREDLAPATSSSQDALDLAQPQPGGAAT